jgi:hypothetical protein
LAVKRGFLIENHEKMGEENANGSILRKSRSPKQRGLPKDDQIDADIHGIADVAVQAADDEEFCGSDRGGSAQPSHGKLPGTAKVDAGPDEQNENSDPSQWPPAG